VLLHPHLDVLEQTLRALLARPANALAGRHVDRAGRADGDLRVPGDVLHVQPRHAAHGEVALHDLRVLLAAEIAEIAEVEVEVHRVADAAAKTLSEAGAHARAHRAADLVAKTAALVARS